MAVDTAAPRTRRAILAGAFGGLAAWVASGLGRPEAVSAGIDGDVVLGATNIGADSTTIENNTTAEPALVGRGTLGDGVHGQSDSTVGQGVYGYATAATGETFGVNGTTESTGGTGVFGHATAASGFTAGVSGLSESPDGTGVGGTAGATSGINYGTQGTSFSTEGTGVYGSAVAASGKTFGVKGESDSTDGRGVGGVALATSGSTFGVTGKAQSPDGTGVWGWAAASTGSACGVFGVSESTEGSGVSGSAYAESGSAFGVYGSSASPTGTAVAGVAIRSTGVLGYSGPGGMGPPAPDPKPKTGVFGLSTIDSAAVGVRGESTSGTGVQAVATTGYALRTSGRVRLDKASGVATITSGHSTVTVTPGLDVTTTSFVLLTPKADLGSRRLWYTTSTTSNTITIRVNSPVSGNVAIGWLLLG